MFGRIWKSKVFRNSVIGIITAVGFYLQDRISLEQLTASVFTGLALIFNRDAQAKGGSVKP